MIHTINAIGKACPLPVIETKKAIESLTGSATLEVLVDNEIAVQNVLKLAAHKGLNACSETKTNGPGVPSSGCYAVRIICGQPPAAPSGASGPYPAPEPIPFSASCFPFQPSSVKTGTVVVIASPQMGTGEEALGKLLMKSYLFSLTKQDLLPETILFYNSGAFLTCEGSESLEDLNLLEEKGVEIMTCGTCLDFYHLKEKLAVGTVSNMYDIAQKQLEALSVIRP